MGNNMVFEVFFQFGRCDVYLLGKNIQNMISKAEFYVESNAAVGKIQKNSEKLLTISIIYFIAPTTIQTIELSYF